MTASTSSLPKHWPSNITYLCVPSYSSSLSSDVLNQIRGTRPSPKSAPSSHVLIRRIALDTHPAFGQYGLFATRVIAANTHICDYLGEIHCEDRVDSDYDLCLIRLSDGTAVGIDASKMGNEGRFINDYRGVKDKPNAVFKDIRTSIGELRMSIWSGPNKIRKGEEILVSYGKSWWKARQSETSCNDV